MARVIHPTAVVSAKAELGEDVSIGPYSVIAEDVACPEDNHFSILETFGDGKSDAETGLASPEATAIALKTKDGAWLAISACWNNPEKTLEDAKFIAILQAAVYAIPK